MRLKCTRSAVTRSHTSPTTKSGGKKQFQYRCRSAGVGVAAAAHQWLWTPFFCAFVSFYPTAGVLTRVIARSGEWESFRVRGHAMNIYIKKNNCKLISGRLSAHRTFIWCCEVAVCEYKHANEAKKSIMENTTSGLLIGTLWKESPIWTIFLSPIRFSAMRHMPAIFSMIFKFFYEFFHILPETELMFYSIRRIFSAMKWGI